MIRLRGIPALVALGLWLAVIAWIGVSALSGPPEPRVAYGIAFGLAARGLLDWIGSWFAPSPHSIEPKKRDKPECD